MEITFKDTEEFFYTGVHPSGYYIARQPISSNLDRGRSVTAYVQYILPNKENEALIKKKVSLTEFFMDIEIFRKECPSPTESNLFVNDNFLENLVNKYGFLEGTKDFWLFLRRVTGSSWNQYNAFMEGEIIEGIPSLILNDQTFNENYIQKEEVALWIWLLRINFTKPNTKNKEPQKLAKWSKEDIYEDKLISNSFPRRDSESNKIMLEASCLGSAYLFFRYSKNITETKRCLNCETLFADASRSNNQKFCSEKCRVNAYRERQVNSYKKEIKATRGSYLESEGKYEHLQINYNDKLKSQIRRVCTKHGEFITKREMLKNDPGCPECRRNKH